MAAQRDAQGRFIKGSGGGGVSIEWTDKQMLRDLRDHMLPHFQAFAADVASAASAAAPVDEGELSQNIKMEKMDKKPWQISGFSSSVKGKIFARVVADVPHALYVELGTSRQEKQPYLWPTMEQKKNELRSRLSRDKYIGTKVAGRW